MKVYEHICLTFLLIWKDNMWINSNVYHLVPDALPKRFVSLKPIVTAKHNTINIQLISGM